VTLAYNLRNFYYEPWLLKENVFGFSLCRQFSLATALCCVAACHHHVADQTGAGSHTSDRLPPVELPVESTPSPVEKSPYANITRRLLRQAELSFRAGRYTTPSHDNAFDKFHSVLLVNPQNARARAGLQAILLQYSQLIRTALNEGRLDAANNYLQQVETFYPANSLLMDLKTEIKKARGLISDQEISSQHLGPIVEEISIPAAELSAKSQLVIDMLASISSRLRDTKESIYIYARSDREGRWIYKQLKLSAEGYRVRGDIRISQVPKLHIMPPL